MPRGPSSHYKRRHTGQCVSARENKRALSRGTPLSRKEKEKARKLKKKPEKLKRRIALALVETELQLGYFLSSPLYIFQLRERFGSFGSWKRETALEVVRLIWSSEQQYARLLVQLFELYDNQIVIHLM
jgi:hypothetical protein